MKRIMLLGGSGFIGKNLADILSTSGYSVCVFDKKKSEEIVNKNIDYHYGDIKNIDSILNFCESTGVEVIIHLISSLLPASNFSEYSNEISNVLIPSFNLFHNCALKGIKIVYFSSGGTIYGNNEKIKFNEEDKTKPLSYYGLSKLQTENFIKKEGVSSGLKFLIVRPSNPFGKYQNINGKQGLIAVALGKMLNGENLDIWGDGKIIRDYINIDIICNLIIQLLELPFDNEVYNLGSGIGFSVLEIIRIIQDSIGIKAKLNFLEMRETDVPRVVLDNCKIKKRLAIEIIETEKSIANYCKYIKSSYGK